MFKQHVIAILHKHHSFSIQRQVLDNVERAQERQRDTFAKRQLKGVKVFHLQVGDVVLRREMRNVGRKGDQMKSKWIGPYKYVHREHIFSILLICN